MSKPRDWIVQATRDDRLVSVVVYGVHERADARAVVERELGDRWEIGLATPVEIIFP